MNWLVSQGRTLRAAVVPSAARAGRICGCWVWCYPDSGRHRLKSQNRIPRQLDFTRVTLPTVQIEHDGSDLQ